MFFNPIDGAAHGFVSGVGADDDLKAEAPLFFKEAVALAEIGFEEIVADGFEHFDGNDGIEGTLNLAIIGQEDGDPVGHAGLVDALACFFELGP